MPYYMLFDLYSLSDYALLALRIIVAIVFFSSGKGHIQKPKERAESIGMSPTFTLLLGIAEVTGAISVAGGIYIQIGAALLICTMLGAIYKKIFVWKTGFYAEKGFGWHYDLILLAANLVFISNPGDLLIYP
ncbi:DoxX family protein [Leeuwenhoekiella sp. A16]|uniref:DoxX family protein n=1 Tax=unclassified Leeuwenhoekiella TaxID=2615029 RepID=UPI003A7F8F24